MTTEDFLDLYLEKRLLYEEMRFQPNRCKIREEYQGLAKILHPKLQDTTHYKGHVIKKGWLRMKGSETPVLQLYSEKSYAKAQKYLSKYASPHSQEGSAEPLSTEDTTPV